MQELTIDNNESTDTLDSLEARVKEDIYKFLHDSEFEKYLPVELLEKEINNSFDDLFNLRMLVILDEFEECCKRFEDEDGNVLIEDIHTDFQKNSKNQSNEVYHPEDDEDVDIDELIILLFDIACRNALLNDIINSNKELKED